MKGSHDFWSGVEIGTPGECWPWTRGRSDRGYGKVQIGGRSLRAHRVAFELAVRPLESGELVLHRCDNPPCCNPAHLYPGDHKRNALDKVERGRCFRPQGSRHGLAKLTEADVRWIRQELAAGSRAADIARTLEVDPSVVSNVKRGKRWTHAT